MTKRPTALKLAIRRSHYTQQQIADCLGIKKGTLSSYVTGRSDLPAALAKRIEKLIGESLHPMAFNIDVESADELEPHPQSLHPFLWLLLESLAVSIHTNASTLWARVEGLEPMPSEMVGDVARALGVPFETVVMVLRNISEKTMDDYTRLRILSEDMEALKIDVEKVRNELSSRGLIQKWVSERVGVNPKTFHSYLTGQARMPRWVLRNLAALLRTSMANLMAKEEKVEPDSAS